MIVKFVLMRTRSPEETRKHVPILIGRKDKTFLILFDADIDGCEPVSRAEAEDIIRDLAGVDIRTFAQLAQWENIIIKI